MLFLFYQIYTIPNVKIVFLLYLKFKNLFGRRLITPKDLKINTSFL